MSTQNTDTTLADAIDEGIATAITAARARVNHHRDTSRTLPATSRRLPASPSFVMAEAGDAEAEATDEQIASAFDGRMFAGAKAEAARTGKAVITAEQQRTLPAGTYYVGDLCYVLKYEYGYDWAVQHKGLGARASDGYGTAHGTGIMQTWPTFSSYTANGDGCYEDQEHDSYEVDSGTIGCINVNALSPEAREHVRDTRCGHFVTYDKPFRCTPCTAGVITIGRLTIDTARDF